MQIQVLGHSVLGPRLSGGPCSVFVFVNEVRTGHVAAWFSFLRQEQIKRLNVSIDNAYFLLYDCDLNLPYKVVKAGLFGTVITH